MCWSTEGSFGEFTFDGIINSIKFILFYRPDLNQYVNIDGVLCNNFKKININILKEFINYNKQLFWIKIRKVEE